MSGHSSQETSSCDDGVTYSDLSNWQSGTISSLSGSPRDKEQDETKKNEDIPPSWLFDPGKGFDNSKHHN